MIETNLWPAGATAADATARMLVCSVDRGLFGIQAGWVEAVYPTASTPVHSTRTDAGQRQPFIVHRARTRCSTPTAASAASSSAR